MTSPGRPAITGDATMNAVDDKRFIQAIHAGMDKGNGKPFVHSLAEDASGTVRVRTPWSRSYKGKRAVQDELLKPLFARFDGPYRSKAERFIAEDDLVVVQFSGDVATRAGKRYQSQYCHIYRLAGGKVVELTEYLDTALVEGTAESGRHAARRAQGRAARASREEEMNGPCPQEASIRCRCRYRYR
jgi:ketosteroid isomerase-like protein